MAGRDRFVISAEHAGHAVPERYAALFPGRDRLLASHRGWDPGSLALARALSRALHAPLHTCTTTRLLVDTNRSLGHRALFSRATRTLPPAEKRLILDRWYLPHRAGVEQAVHAEVARRHRVIHLAVHSFTPVLGRVTRPLDVGLLYDPKRPGEVAFCHTWQAALQGASPELRVRRNQPYRGTADGLTTHLRRRFENRDYLGIELEVNQRFPLGPPAAWLGLRRLLVRSLRAGMPELASGSRKD